MRDSYAQQAAEAHERVVAERNLLREANARLESELALCRRDLAEAEARAAMAATALEQSR